MKIIQLPSVGYLWLMCSQTFLVFLLLSPYKTIAFHKATKHSENKVVRWRF